MEPKDLHELLMLLDDAYSIIKALEDDPDRKEWLSRADTAFRQHRWIQGNTKEPPADYSVLPLSQFD